MRATEFLSAVATVAGSGGKALLFRGHGGLHSYRQFRRLSERCWQITAPSSVIDVGANTGQFGFAARMAFPRAPVISFEPNPHAYRELARASRDDPLWTAIESGVGRTREARVFYEHAYSVESSFLRSHSGGGSSPVERQGVSIVPLDVLMEPFGLDGHALLKIDVQGYELKVLQGATQILDEVRSVLVEIAFQPSYEGQPRFQSVNSFLTLRGFDLVRFEDPLVDRDTGAWRQADAWYLKVKQSGR